MAEKLVKGFQFGAHDGEAPFVWINPGENSEEAKTVEMLLSERLVMRVNVIPDGHRNDMFLVVAKCDQIPVSGPYSSSVGRGHLLHFPSTGNLFIGHYCDDKGNYKDDMTCGPQDHCLVHDGTVVEISVYAVTDQGIVDGKMVTVNDEPVASVKYVVKVVTSHVRAQYATSA